MSNDGVEVRRDDVERALALLLERVFGSDAAVRLPHDYYWAVATRPASYDMDAVPEPTVGQLSYDIERIRDLIADYDEVIGYGLAFVAPVLAALAFARPG
jgi:hypothetical protein